MYKHVYRYVHVVFTSTYLHDMAKPRLLPVMTLRTRGGLRSTTNTLKKHTQQHSAVMITKQNRKLHRTASEVVVPRSLDSFSFIDFLRRHKCCLGGQLTNNQDKIIAFATSRMMLSCDSEYSITKSNSEQAKAGRSI